MHDYGYYSHGFRYECSDYPLANLRMLKINNSESTATIEKFDLQTFKDDGEDVVVGYSPDFDNSASISTGRNFVGVKNRNIEKEGYGTVVFVISDNLTSDEAIQILKNQGCEDGQIMQLDGSTVAQFSEKVNNEWRIP